MDVHEKRKRSIDSLQRLYTVVVALALTEAVRSLLNLKQQANPSDVSTTAIVTLAWLPFWILVATIVPFYHGANGHLDQVYLYTTSHRKRHALLIDFAMLFGEALVFLFLALSLGSFPTFASWFFWLLVLDVLWAFAVYMMSDSDDGHPHSKRWLIINIVAVVAVYVSQNTSLLNSDARAGALLGIALLRTAVDYWTCWDFYVARYPDQNDDQTKQPSPVV
jgi:hypothetical protein